MCKPHKVYIPITYCTNTIALYCRAITMLYDHLYFRILHLHKPIGLSTRQVNHRRNSAAHEWYQTFDSGSETCSIFFDPQKTFDSVSQHSLIAKLSLLNISSYSSKSVCWSRRHYLPTPTSHLRCPPRTVHNLH